MEFQLVRKDSTRKRTFGELASSINVIRFCLTLENTVNIIPEGTFEIKLMLSGRAEAGEWWTPRDDESAMYNAPLDHKLPMIMVPGRTSIFFRTAAEAKYLDGSIAVGYDRIGDTLIHSRQALTSLMQKLVTPAFITIRDE